MLQVVLIHKHNLKSLFFILAVCTCAITTIQVVLIQELYVSMSVELFSSCLKTLFICICGNISLYREIEIPSTFSIVTTGVCIRN